MSKHAKRIDTDAVIQAANPLLNEPSAQEIDAGLERLLAHIANAPTAARQTPRNRPRARRRPRLAFGGGLAVLAAGIAFGVVNALPTADGPAVVGTASAKQIIARTAAAMTGSGNGIVHVDVVVTSDDPFSPGKPTETESWSEQDAPHSFWDVYHSWDGTVSYGTDTNDVDSIYYPSTNTIRVAPDSHVGEDDLDPTLSAVQAVEQANTPDIPAGETISQAVQNLLNTPGLTIDENATVNGTPAIAISSGPPNTNLGPDPVKATLYLSPQTYTPIEETQSYTAHGPNNQTAPVTTVTTFRTYEILADGSVQAPNLQEQHPNATVVTVTPSNS